MSTTDDIKAAAEAAREAIDALRRSCDRAIASLDAGKYFRVGPGEFQADRCIAAAAILQERLRARDDAAMATPSVAKAGKR